MSFWKKPIEPPPTKMRFYPQPDITAYELATICAKCDPNNDIYFHHGQWETLGPDLQRHFK
jgi:hypothetical protein